MSLACSVIPPERRPFQRDQAQLPGPGEDEDPEHPSHIISEFYNCREQQSFPVLIPIQQEFRKVLWHTCQNLECFRPTNSTQGVLSISWVRAGNQLQKLHQNSSQKGRLLLRISIIYISGTCSCRTKRAEFVQTLSRESSSVGFNEEAPQPRSAFQSFPLLSHSKAALALRCRFALSPNHQRAPEQPHCIQHVP